MNGFSSKGKGRAYDEDEELFDETADVRPQLSTEQVYGDCTTISWPREYAKERLRALRLGRERGLKGAGAKLWDGAKPWIVIVLTGVGTGVLAAYLDVLTEWLSDLRAGVCPSDFHLSQAACCAGLDPGEECYSWVSWADYFDLISPPARAVIGYFVYLLTAVVFATSSAVLVQSYAPQAFHTGIPEIKTILNGYILQNFFSGWTLLIKALGITLSVASGLSLGKEGPMVHVACSIGSITSKLFDVFRDNEARKREILSAAAAAGVSVAFGAPLGGVLFSLEELSSFFPDTVLWQSFVCAIVAAVTLQYLDPYGTGRLVLFEVTTSQVYRGFELIPFVLLGIIGGVFGHFFIKFNIAYAKLRASEFARWPILEVALVSLVTSLVSYLIVYARMPTSDLVQSLFSDCSSDPHGLCDRDAQTYVVFLLLVTAAAKAVMTSITFGIRVPAGIFLPSIAIGSCIGRAMGICVSALQQTYPLFFLFSGCPVDGPCVSPTVYAVIGAAATLGGVTRMTVSLIVVFMELTGAVSSVLSIMIAVMVSKFTGDFLARDGIYESWIKLRSYPFLDPKVEYRRDTVCAKDVMTPIDDLVTIVQGHHTVSHLEEFAKEYEYRGYPIVKSDEDPVLCGYILRSDLLAALAQARQQRSVFGTTRCILIRDAARDQKSDYGDESSLVNLSAWVDQTPMTLSANSAQEIVVQLFQRIGLRYLILTRRGRVAGLLTKTDVHDHICEEGIASAKADLLRRKSGNDSFRARDARGRDESPEEGWDDSGDADALMQREVEARTSIASDRL